MLVEIMVSVDNLYTSIFIKVITNTGEPVDQGTEIHQGHS